MLQMLQMLHYPSPASKNFSLQIFAYMIKKLYLCSRIAKCSNLYYNESETIYQMGWWQNTAH